MRGGHNLFQLGPVTFDSDFDSGNLQSVQRVSSAHFSLWVAADHPDNQYRCFFHFRVSGLEGLTTFTVRNFSGHYRLLSEGLVPVFRTEHTSWQRIRHHISAESLSYEDQGLQFSFRHSCSRNWVWFAFCYPFSTADCLRQLESLSQLPLKESGIYFNRTTLVHSLQGRDVLLVTVTSNKGASNKTQPLQDKSMFPKGGRPLCYQKRKSVVISARVHPGEVPSSHVMTGMLNFICSNDIRAALLRENFVFQFVPILNPDGVFRGNYRTDSKGNNLNRFYINPNSELHSPVYALKKLILHLHSADRLEAHIDLHAHAGRKGFFIYGNCASEIATQLKICLFPKLLSLNSRDFQYEGSNFTEANMRVKDRADKQSKEGAARVALFRKTKNPQFWTIECNYNISSKRNALFPRVSEKVPAQVDILQTPTNFCELPKQKSVEFYNLQTFHQFGTEVLQTFLDLKGIHPDSRLPNSPFGSLSGLSVYLSAMLLRMTPFRFEPEFKKVLLALDSEGRDKAVNALLQTLVYRQQYDKIQGLLEGKDKLVLPAPKKSLMPIRKRDSTAKQSASTKISSEKEEGTKTCELIREGLTQQARSILKELVLTDRIRELSLKQERLEERMEERRNELETGGKVRASMQEPDQSEHPHRGGDAGQARLRDPTQGRRPTVPHFVNHHEAC